MLPEYCIFIAEKQFQFYFSKGILAVAGDRDLTRENGSSVSPLSSAWSLPVPKPAAWWLAGSYYISQPVPRAWEGQAPDALITRSPRKAGKQWPAAVLCLEQGAGGLGPLFRHQLKETSSSHYVFLCQCSPVNNREAAKLSSLDPNPVHTLKYYIQCCFYKLDKRSVLLPISTCI